MATTPFVPCAARHPDGWLCILAAAHTDEHLSFDNRVLWEGSPGAPVWWTVGRVPLGVLEGAGETQQVPAGFSGVACDACGSMQTVQTGKCVTCQVCYHSGSCG